jgi:pilus assembly protein CpaB
LAIPTDTLAVSVQLADPARVAGFVVPGSDIAVLATWEEKPAGDGETITHTAVILPRVQVIAVGPSTLERDGGTGAGAQQVPTAILTLALAQKEAEKLVLAQKVGELYLGLVSENSAVAADGGITNDTLGRKGAKS